MGDILDEVTALIRCKEGVNSKSVEIVSGSGYSFC